jgi:DNA-binding MarR family transcriptional regulator
MDHLKELRDVMSCPCLGIRRATRRITQLYDHVLAPSGLTANQFGQLAHLLAADLTATGGLSIGTMADRLGMDPTTLNRNLKPLEAKGFVRDAPSGSDGRVRTIKITEKGKRTLQRALPFWRRARDEVEKALGSMELATLNELLDLATARIVLSNA